MELSIVCEDVLPNEPSELLAIALHDLIKCEKDPHYEINMSVFLWNRRGKCVVDLVGSVVAQSLPLDHLDDSLNHFTPNAIREASLRAKLMFLSACRSRKNHMVPHLFNLITGDELKTDWKLPEITPYYLSQKKFKNDVHCLAVEFENMGY